MNTVGELTPSELQQPDSGLGSVLHEPPDQRDEQIAALQAEVQDLKNTHAEDKFLWFLAAIAAFDVAALLHATNWTAPVIVGLIQLIAIVVMASRCKVDVVAPLIDKVAGMLTRK